VRASSITARLQVLLIPEKLVTNAFLASAITPQSTIPVETILADGVMIRWRATPHDIVQASTELNLAFVGSPERPEIRLAYRPMATELRLRNLDSAHKELRHFLRFVMGSRKFFLSQFGADFLLRLSEPSQAFSLWRALNYIPFRGKLIDVSLNLRNVDGDVLDEEMKAELAKLGERARRQKHRYRHNRLHREGLGHAAGWTWTDDKREIRPKTTKPTAV
jgi:hypothetical protein